MKVLIKDTYQKYERQLALKIKFQVIQVYVIFLCVSKFKINLSKHFIFISYHSSSKYRKYKATNNVHSGKIIFVENLCIRYKYARKTRTGMAICMKFAFLSQN